MASYATLEEIESIASDGYGWCHMQALDGSRDGQWCSGSRLYSNDRFPTWQLFVANLGQDDAFAAIENDRGQQFADCDLVSWEYDEALDNFNMMLSAAERGVYDQFR